MKKLILAFFPIALFAACQKSGSSPSQIPSSTKLSSARVYNGSVIVRADTFTYTASGNFSSQREWTYTNGVSNKDTFTVSFSYTGGNNANPSAYTITDGWGVNTYSLTYDNQGRVVKDTIIPDIAARAGSFSYPNNNIAYTSADNGSADTLYLSGGNIVKTAQATIPFDPNAYHVITFSYSGAYPNPFYYTGQSDNVRILLTKIDARKNFANDFTSQHAYTSVHDSGGFSVNFTYSTDPGTGRVIKAAALGASAAYVYQ
jgi:hypothetical protein